MSSEIIKMVINTVNKCRWKWLLIFDPNNKEQIEIDMMLINGNTIMGRKNNRVISLMISKNIIYNH